MKIRLLLQPFFCQRAEKMRSILLLILIGFSSVLFAQNNQNITVAGRVAAGDTALAGVTVNVKGTAVDNTMGMTAGSSMDSKQVDVVKVKDGKMVEHWGFLDWQDVMKMGQQPTMDSSGKMKK